jgi:YVTN family beta-propeller protein
MKRRPRHYAALAVFLVALVAAGVAVADDLTTGEIGPALGITANGHALHPVGRLTTVGNFPTGSALTANGRFLWVADCGHGYNDVRVVDVASGAAVQTLPLPGCYGGIAIAPDGRHAYVDGDRRGASPTEGPTKGDQGDVIHVFTVDPGTGHGVERDPIQLPATIGGTGRANSFPPVGNEVGTEYPEGVAISPDGSTLAVALNTADRAVLIDLATKAESVVPVGRYPNSAVFDRQGRAYISNEYDGTVSVIDPSSHRVTHTITGLGGQLGDLASHPEGMVTDPIRDRIYVAVTNRDLVAAIDTDSESVTSLISVGRPEGLGTAPVKLAVTPDGSTLYAADSGEDAVAAVSLSQRPGAGKRIASRRVFEPPTVSSIGRFTVLEQAAARKLAKAHGHARAAALRLYRTTVAKLTRRYLAVQSVIACGGPSSRQAAAFVSAVLRAETLSGRERVVAISHAQARLPKFVICPAAPGFVPNLPADKLIGRLPTAAYPDDVQVTADGSQLIWIAGKGLGSGPNPTYNFDGARTPLQTPPNTYGTYVLDLLLGRVGALQLPTDRQVQAETAVADAQARPNNPESAPAGSPIPAPGSGPSQQIKHVFYIVRENRTYDQVFGSDPRGDGQANLELLDNNGVSGPTGGITPNAHSLAQTFPLLDHFYEDSEVSVDGHIITTGAYATDYVQKATAANYSARRSTYDFGIFPVTFPPKFFVFDQAAAQGISFRDYGEAVGAIASGSAPNRPQFATVTAGLDSAYPNNIFIGCLAAGVIPSCTQDSGTYNGTGKLFAGQSRFNEWYPQFQAEVASGTVPTLIYMILPNDHTNGTTTKDFTPQAMIADNDLALGQIVDAISHSSIWPQSAIFVQEDDSQDGADHVDSHRSPAFVISPWARHGAVVHTRYDQYSMLRTAELIAGIDPLSLGDALATPMYDAFVSGGTAPDNTPFTVVAPTQDIAQTNTASAADAHVSNALPWNQLDAVPQEISDQVLWAAVHGTSLPAPPPGPNASAIEHERAVAIRKLLRTHGDIAAFLGRGAGDG